MCLCPIHIRVNNIDGVRTVEVPCGHCEECLKRYQNDWMVRLCEECNNWRYVTFFTLTYNDDSVPRYVDRNSGAVYNTVYKKHVQRWLDRLRVTLRRFYKDDDFSFKYFITSEYGPRTLRPHYHGILFGVRKIDFDRFSDWSRCFGFVCSSIVPLANSESRRNIAKYVSKYCSKGVFESPLVSLGLVNPTFHLISKGIGSSYPDRMKAFHLGRRLFRGKSRVSLVGSKLVYTDAYLKWVSCNKLVTLDDNFRYHMPRYYSNLIYGSKNSLSRAIADFLFNQRMQVRDDKLVDVLSNFPAWSYGQACHYLDLQDSCDVVQRRKTCHSSLGKFYDRSTL